MDGTPAGKTRSYGTSHVSPYNYDQHVPVLLMGFGIQPGQYFQPSRPPTLPNFGASAVSPRLRDGHALAEA